MNSDRAKIQRLAKALPWENVKINIEDIEDSEEEIDQKIIVTEERDLEWTENPIKEQVEPFEIQEEDSTPTEMGLSACEKEKEKEKEKDTAENKGIEGSGQGCSKRSKRGKGEQRGKNKSEETSAPSDSATITNPDIKEDPVCALSVEEDALWREEKRKEALRLQSDAIRVERVNYNEIKTQEDLDDLMTEVIYKVLECTGYCARSDLTSIRRDDIRVYYKESFVKEAERQTEEWKKRLEEEIKDKTCKDNLCDPDSKREENKANPKDQSSSSIKERHQPQIESTDEPNPRKEDRSDNAEDSTAIQMQLETLLQEGMCFRKKRGGYMTVSHDNPKLKNIKLKEIALSSGSVKEAKILLLKKAGLYQGIKLLCYID
ncbi:phosphoprotein [Oita virus]|uniref:Phosphoprotein n=1 Tax=Oita virus TaxID=1272953 RepID=A0A0D3R126_9RHAB|nr:phosphoprotein [Oita virus]AJR28399.1 phosphoprotein [Oita virus]